MTTSAGPGDPPIMRSQRWLARLSFVLASLAIVVLVIFGGLKSLAMLAVAVAAAVVSLAAAYFFLARRGVWRWIALAVFVKEVSAFAASKRDIFAGIGRQYRCNHAALLMGYDGLRS